MEGKRIRVLTIKYNEKIQPYEVPCFRGAINAAMGENSDILFHNHTGDATYRYAYPMVQYKRIDGNAAVVFVDDAIEESSKLMFMNDSIMLGNRSVKLTLQAVQPEESVVNVTEEMHSYHLHQWQPLNKENYRKFNQAESIVEKVEMLEKILKGNILSFCKGLGIILEDELTLTITSLPMMRMMKNKGVGMQVCSLDFKANIVLPDNIGLGKNTSLGYGIVKNRC